jgi:hypothetical protein
MSKTIQYRCPVCCRLLIKWEVGAAECQYKAEGLRFIEQKGSEKKDIVCTKCDTRLEITRGGLRTIDLVAV